VIGLAMPAVFPSGQRNRLQLRGSSEARSASAASRCWAALAMVAVQLLNSLASLAAVEAVLENRPLDLQRVEPQSGFV